MEKSKIVFLIYDSVRAVKAAYEEGRAPDTFKTLDPEIAVGDLVVVESGTRWGLTIAKVVEVDVEPDLDSMAEVKWIAGAVDAETYEGILAKEKAMIEAVQASERRQRKAALRAALVGDDERLAALNMITVDAGEDVTE